MKVEKEMNATKFVDQLVSSMHEISDRLQQHASQERIDSQGEQPEILRRLCDRKDFQAILHLHNLVSSFKDSKFERHKAVDSRLRHLVSSTCSLLRESPFKSDVQEILHLLNRPHMQALFSAHDCVAIRDYEPHLIDIPYEVDEDDGLAVKIVRLIKHNEPLGATIKVDEKSGHVLVARVLRGGVADRSGCIHIGDRVLEVNNQVVDGKKPTDIVKILGSSSNGTVIFKLVPAPETVASPLANPPCLPHLRCLFDYDPHIDPLIPCSEAGLAFKKGDILQLVSKEDQHWWQARFLTTPQKVGLIPSVELQEKKHAAIRSPEGSRRSSGPKKIRPIMYETQLSEELDKNEVRTYEEVALLYPRKNLLRPLVFIGAPGVGRNELKRRLMLLKPDHYGTTVPHTSRPQKIGEVSGVDYFFVSRAQMEKWIVDGQFVEFGEYKGNIYGTTLEALRQVCVVQGKVCLLNPHPQALRMLRTAEIKPYVIFIKPPPFPLLKATRSCRLETRSEDYARNFTDDELKKMIEHSRKLEENFGHLFDYVLVNGNLEVAFRELCDMVNCVETEPQWAPVGWVR